MKLDDLIYKISKGFLLTLAGALSVNTASIPITSYINNKMDSDKRTVVFTSGFDNGSFFEGKITSGIIDFFMYSPVTLRQNLNGNKTMWKSNLTKKEVLKYLKDPQYQNIVFIGHGSHSSYETINNSLTINDLSKLNLSNRQGGEFIQYTCGAGDGKGLREGLYPNGSEGYSFDKKVSAYQIYAKALSELFYYNLNKK